MNNQQHDLWKQKELIYREREATNKPFVSRRDIDPGLPPSAIPGNPIWFQKPLYVFGQHLVAFNAETPPDGCMEGYVSGMQWDEMEWEYTLMGRAGIPFPINESEVIPYSTDSMYELTVFKDLETDLWVFNDPERNLYLEPFVRGMDLILDRLSILVPNAKAGFIFRFSDRPFLSGRAALMWEKEEDWGNWYYCPQFGMKGWLCPALFEYYKPAPKAIYIEAVALG